MAGANTTGSADGSRVTADGFFVTGTDTGVGKTLVACALLRAFANRGMRAVGMKPIAAGAAQIGMDLVNDDVTALRGAGSIDAPQDLVNPYCFAPAIAPHIAAADAGVEIELGRLERAFLALVALADCVVVEGAGGFRVPLGPNIDTCDLAVRLGLPVILVVGLRLGCLNHALLTAEAVARAGLELAGWVANHIDPDMARADENVGALESRLRAPLLARLPYSGTIDAARVACNIKLDLLRLPLALR
jgi:dethiobiotin synthetase